MTQPIIGITANQRVNPDVYNIPWSYVPTGFVKGVTAAGGLPLLLPIGKPETAKAYVDMVDKLIIIGGQNVDPSFYGEENQAVEDDFLLERDLFEIAIIKEAMRQQKPIFAVCRGMQLLNVVLGGSLNQDVKEHWQEEHFETLTQDLIVEKDSLLSQIYGKSTSINSFHRQCLKDIAPDLKIAAYDPKDGMVEAVEAVDPNKRLLGVQWHPELLQDCCTTSQQLFDFVVKKL